MIIEYTKDGMKITHPTGEIQIVSKVELEKHEAELQNKIDELTTQKIEITASKDAVIVKELEAVKI